MYFFDSHAHYDDPRFDEDREQLVSALPDAGVIRVVDVGADLPSSRRAAAIAEQYPFVYAAAGVHPHEAKSWDDFSEAELRSLLSHPKNVALGEIGLDFHYDLSDREVQRTVFRKQMELASMLDIPVIIHSREACEPTLEVLRDYPARGVVHCFSGSVETARELLNDGWYLGFTGVVTYKNARKTVEVAEYVPLDRLLIETDCPYLSPQPCRGQRCDSRMLVHTVNKLAECKGVSPETIAEAACRNACALYRLPMPRV